MWSYDTGVTRPLPSQQQPQQQLQQQDIEVEARNVPHRLPSILENTHAAFPVVEALPGEEPLPRGLSRNTQFDMLISGDLAYWHCN